MYNKNNEMLCVFQKCLFLKRRFFHVLIEGPRKIWWYVMEKV